MEAHDYNGMTIQNEKSRLEYAVNVAAKEAREKELIEGREQGLEQGKKKVKLKQKNVC